MLPCSSCFVCMSAILPPGKQTVKWQEWPSICLYPNGSLAHHQACIKNYTNKSTNSNKKSSHYWWSVQYVLVEWVNHAQATHPARSLLLLPQQSRRWWDVSMSEPYTSSSTPWWIRTSQALRSSAQTQTASERGSVLAAERTVVIVLATMPRKWGTRGIAKCT